MGGEDGLPDALWFYDLVLPMHHVDNTRIATVPRDPRQSFYVNVSKWSNMYAAGELQILGGGYGHEFKPTNPVEIVRWDGSIYMDGVLGDSKGVFLRRFKRPRPGYVNKLYDADISNAFSKNRWLEIKRVYKLCNNLTAIKRGQPGYNPAYKYDLSLIHI